MEESSIKIPVYGVWMNAVIFKVQSDGKIINKAVQIAVGLNNQGKRKYWVCGLARTRVHPFG